MTKEAVIKEGFVYSVDGVIGRIKMLARRQVDKMELQAQRQIAVVQQGNGFKLAYADTAFAVHAKERGRVVCMVDRGSDVELVRKTLTKFVD